MLLSGLLYFLFKPLMSRSTFFRFNRITLLVRYLGCTLLPLIELTTTEETFCILRCMPFTRYCRKYGVSHSKSRTDGRSYSISEKNPEINSLNWIPVTLALYMESGGFGDTDLVVFVHLSFDSADSYVREKQFGNYVLVILSSQLLHLAGVNILLFQQLTTSTVRRNTSTKRCIYEIIILWTYCLCRYSCLFIGFNPAVWLLKRELQEVHEFEADNGVINTGIDATQHQLLLVKKLLVQGSTLWLMALITLNLKNVSLMMLKRKNQPLSTIKAVAVAPVMAGALYVFAQPEVKEVPRQIQSELQQKEADDYSS